MNCRRVLHLLWGTLSVIWAASMLAVVGYNYEDLSGTFGGLEGHPLLLIMTAYSPSTSSVRSWFGSDAVLVVTSVIGTSHSLYLLEQPPSLSEPSPKGSDSETAGQPKR